MLRTTDDICSTPEVIFSASCAWSEEASAILVISLPTDSVFSTTSSSAEAVWLITDLPAEMASIEPSISSVVSRAASADFWARFLTSSATTANPFPAAPARAASMAALSASMFVWNAMSSIVFIIFPISSDFWVITSIASTISFIFWLLSFTAFPVSMLSRLAASAFLLFSEILSVISERLEERSSTDEACSVDPWLRLCAPAATWSDPPATWSAAVPICESVELSDSDMFMRASFIFANSPL